MDRPMSLDAQFCFPIAKRMEAASKQTVPMSAKKKKKNLLQKPKQKQKIQV